MSAHPDSKSPPDFISERHHQSLRSIFSNYQIVVLSCRYWEHESSWSRLSRIRIGSFFSFPVKGCLRVHLNGKKTVLSPGKFLMLPENTHHGLDIPKGHDVMHQFAMLCHIHDRWGRPLLSRFPSSFGSLPTPPFWEQTLHELCYLMQNDLDLGQQRGEAIVKEILAWQLSLGVKLTPEAEAGDPRVSIVIQSMEKNLSSSDLSVDILAQEVGITSSQLLRLFRRETGIAPKQFLNKLRFRKASRLLRHTTESIKQVAASCGFSNDHYFHIMFRKKFDCTPSEYRHNK